MPSILVNKAEFERLLGAAIDLSALPRELEAAKAELKGHDPGTGELKIELNDTNRPDLWSPEGLARQLRLARSGAAPRYAFFNGAGDGTRRTGDAARRARRKPAAVPEIRVDPALAEIRPYVAGFIASGAKLDDAGLRSLIQSQEKLAEGFGRRRHAVAIGVYRADMIRFPVHYRAADPHAERYVPLGFDQSLTLAAILDQHPKGREYGHLLRGKPRFPLLVDSAGCVLSMPPIVNSQSLGAVEVGDRDLFVEVTGHDLRILLLALNIAAVDLADRGAQIRPIAVVYPYKTPFGRRLRTPFDFAKAQRVSLPLIKSMLGEAMPAKEIQACLRRSGYRDIRVTRGSVTVTPPPYRDDLLHAVDVIEDIAIARGYNLFEPILPEEFTVGRISPEETLARRVGDLMIGAGFQQVVSNILTSSEALLDRMGRRNGAGGGLVEIENVMSANYAVLRDSILPSLLAVEGVSSKAAYPHRVFEVGECEIADPATILGTRTQLKLGALVAHAAATFSELHSTLDTLLFYLGREHSIEPEEQPFCLPGRSGRIRIDGQAAGWIGEIHPQCLERWDIGVPASGLELDLGVLRNLRPVAATSKAAPTSA
jgi:phenylalanyl-tRNA synthetase beta chain